MDGKNMLEVDPHFQGSISKEHTGCVWLVVSPHLKNMLVKLDHFPRDRGEKKNTIFELPPRRT